MAYRDRAFLKTCLWVEIKIYNSITRRNKHFLPVFVKMTQLFF